jgi:hypothetical protein
VDGGAGRAGTVKAGFSPSTVAGRAAVSVPDVFRRESALEAHKRRSILNVIDLATGWKIEFDHPQVARLQPGGIQASPTGEPA